MIDNYLEVCCPVKQQDRSDDGGPQRRNYTLIWCHLTPDQSSILSTIWIYCVALRIQNGPLVANGSRAFKLQRLELWDMIDGFCLTHTKNLIFSIFFLLLFFFKATIENFEKCPKTYKLMPMLMLLLMLKDSLCQKSQT